MALYPLVTAWERGVDAICWNAPHLLVAHIPENQMSGPTDGIIVLTHFDISAPAFGVGTCWAGFLDRGGKVMETSAGGACTAAGTRDFLRDDVWLSTVQSLSDPTPQSCADQMAVMHGSDDKARKTLTIRRGYP